MRRKLKSCLVILLSMSIMFSMISNVYASPSDSDSNEHWAANEISKWQTSEIINGYPDGSFRPDSKITRAEFFKIIAETFGLTETVEINFSDVAEDAWYKPYIEKVFAAGYVEGNGNNTVRPEAPISRQEAAKVLAIAFNVLASKDGANEFKDVKDIADWSKDYVNGLAQKGFINGYTDNTFRPTGHITRAESVKMFDNVTGELFIHSQTYKDLVVKGNAIINTAGVTLNNVVIEGDLYLTAGINEGAVNLVNVTVKGKIYVNGTKENATVTIENGKIEGIEIGSKIGITVSQNSKVNNIKANVDGVKINGQALKMGTALSVENGVIKGSTPAPNPAPTPTTAPTTTPTTAPGTGGGSSSENEAIRVEKVTLNKVSATLDIGKETILTATISPANATNKNVIWSSDHEAVATVNNNGLVKAIAEGTATITVTTVEGRKSAAFNVTATTPPSTILVKNVTLDKNSATLDIGEETILTTTISPANATNKNVIWSSDHEAVATVDNNGLVKAIAEGTAIIAVTTVEGGKTAAFNVTVAKPGPEPMDGEVFLGGLFDVKSLEQGKSKYLYVNTIPFASNISVNSTNSSVVKALVEDGNGVKLEAVKEGNAQIVVTASSGEMKSTVQVIDVQVIKPRYEGSQRTKNNINQNWTFKLERDFNDAEKTKNIAAVNFDDSKWEKVTVPHSWNGIDGADGGNNYHKGIGWYRTNLTFDKKLYEGKKVFLEFNAASKVAEVYINGKKIGRHEGGYSIFRFDVTEEILMDQNNILAVSVDNRVNGLMPLSGDFTVFGGMYRDVSIIATDNVHINVMDEGSSGVYWEQKDTITQDKTRYDNGAELIVTSEIINDSEKDRTVNIEAIVYDADFKEVKKVVKENISIAKNGSYNFHEEILVKNPHLWNGTIDPYLYNVVFNVKNGNQLIDTERDRIGFRFYYIDSNDGFFLNGESYRLHGVNRHQDRKDVGYAISYKDHDEDMALMNELGVNTIRFAHYQHDQYVYELSDERGIVAWAEIPLVNGILTTDAFKKNAETNLKELIKQGTNRPSIIMWGIQNEQGVNDQIVGFLQNLYDLGKDMDPSRFITLATDKSEDQPLSWVSDITGWNKYFGLYESRDIYEFDNWIDSVHLKYPDRKIGMSEYGVGSNLEYHQENPPNRSPGTSFDSFQTEEFQSKYHEVHWKAINERPWIWGTYVWNMFEFGSDGRAEAGRRGINNKGLVSYDRETKKDAFYFYKANWSNEPVNRITSSRFYVRDQETINVKVYSNMESVELFLNGESLGKVNKAETEYGMFLWNNVKLKAGDNEVGSIATDANGKTYSDKATWKRFSNSTPAISSDIAAINEVSLDNRTISKVPAGTTIKNFSDVVKPLNNSTFEFYNDKGEKINDVDTLVISGMKLKVISEDGKNFLEYRIVEVPISYLKPATASQIEQVGEVAMVPGYALDGNDQTRWSTLWPGKFPQYMTVDLEAVYNLSSLDSLWYSSANRTYNFRVEVSNDGVNFTVIIPDQKSGNTGTGWTTTSVGENVYGRYVKVTATASSAANASASIYELIIQGFKLDSSNFQIDNNKREISQIGIQFKNDVESFLENLDVSGNYKKVEVKDGNTIITAGTIPEHAKLVVTDVKDREIEYELIFGEDSFSFGNSDYFINEVEKTISNVPAQIGMEQFITELNVIGSFKYKFLLDGSIMDNGVVTGGVQVVLSNISGNVEKTYTINTIEGTTVPISEGKPVKVSDTTVGSGVSNQQINNPIGNINDGNQGTRWAGDTGPVENTSYFPAEVEFNLGKEYILTAVKIDWYNSSSSRAYKYKIDIKPLRGIITNTFDNTNNQTSSYTQHIMDINDNAPEVQDIIFTVTGRTTNVSFHVASVYEFKVYGWNLESDVYIKSGREIKINADEVSLVKFRNNLNIVGNYTLKYLDHEGNVFTGDTITPGCQLVIIDNENREFVYTIAK